jgi:integrase
MPKIVERLNADFVASTTAPGRYHDGAGLYLIVTDGGKSWLYRYTLRGRTREMGLGSVAAFPLAAARKRARAARQQISDGVDPLEEKQAAKAAQRAQEARFVSFEDEARAYITAHRAGWKNVKHSDQWETTLEVYAYPTLARLHVGTIDTDLIVKVLEPIWRTKPETASRLRGRIEKILAFSATRKFRSGENPARWRHHLELLLPARGKVRKVRHHPALPYVTIGDFMAELRRQNGIAAAALELTILCATRTIETIGAEPAEFDLRGKVWTIPAARMKMKREHRIPLADRAVDVIRPLLEGSSGRFVFPGPGKAGHLSNNAMLALLERMKFGRVTTHGFRSTFRDWASECTSFPPEVAEAALAHAIDDKTEAAYRRGDLFLKRRRLMEAWTNFCNTPSAKSADVVPLQKRG